MPVILFSKLGQNSYEAYFPNYISLCKFDEPSFNISQHLDDFQIIGYCSHFVVQNEANIVHKQKFADQDFPWTVFTF